MKRTLLFVVLGLVALVFVYQTAIYLEQRGKAEEGGFASVKEMKLLQRLGFATKEDYEAELWLREQARQIKEDVEAKAAAKRQNEELQAAEAKEALRTRIRNLPTHISVSDTTLYGPEERRGESNKNIAIPKTANERDNVGVEDFRLACELAKKIDINALVSGARHNFFKESAINKMVIESPRTVNTVPIAMPVRWDGKKNNCKAFFNIDGIYNGIRYWSYYFGHVHSLIKNDNGEISVSGFKEGFWKLLSND